MFEFIQRNWIGIVLVAGMLAMHLGGHRHGGHGGSGLMGGCGGHAGHGGKKHTDQHQDGDHATVSQPDSRLPVPSPDDPAREPYRPQDRPNTHQPGRSEPSPGSTGRHC